MTIPLDQIYQETILDHNRRPRNFKEISDADKQSHGINPLCGDDYHIYLKISPDGVIADVGFQGSGCAISKASASMLTQAIKGKKLTEALDLKEKFIGLVTRDCVTEKRDPQALGSLMSFEGVRRFPIRVKCATLIWHAFGDALCDRSTTTTTEE